MKTFRMKRLVIIGDECVRYRLVAEIQQMGAVGYTDYVVHGKGSRGVRPRHAEPPNVKIEVIATQKVVERIFQHVSENYFDKYAMIAFMDEVDVLRGAKFGA